MSTHTLYRFYGPDSELLYVGITGNLTQRLVQHQRKKAWWTSVAYVTTHHYPTRNEVLIAEKAAIETEHPQWNVVYNPARLSAGLSNGEEKGNTSEPPTPTYNGIAVRDCIGVAPTDHKLVLVGQVLEVDSEGVLLDLIDWLTGYFGKEERFFSWDRVAMWRRADRATTQAARREGFPGEPGDRVWDVASLARWQDTYRNAYRLTKMGDSGDRRVTDTFLLGHPEIWPPIRQNEGG